MKINKQNHEKFVLCLVFTTFKEQVDKLNLVELPNYFCIENEHYFYKTFSELCPTKAIS